MTQAEIKRAIAALAKRIVRCPSQPDCDRMEIELLGLYGRLEPAQSEPITRGAK